MLLLNFTHPLTPAHLAALEALAGAGVTRLLGVATQFDAGRPFADQVVELVEGVGLTAAEWQTESILIVPPSHAAIAVTVLAELHGRMGYFPPVVRLRPVENSLPPRWEVAEIINLQAVREAARRQR